MRRFRLILWALIALRRVRSENRKLRGELAAAKVRELALLDRVLTAANQYGLPDARPKNVAIRTPQPPASVRLEPENELERAELEMFTTAATEAGLPAAQGIRDWQQAKAQRRRAMEAGETDE